MGRSRFGKNTVLKFFGGEIRIQPPALRLREFDDRVDQIKGRMGDVRPALDDFGMYMIKEHIPNQFRKQGVPRRWKPLSPAYADQKARDGYGDKGILERTGLLRNSFRYKANARSLQIFNTRRVNGHSLFHIHQRGNRSRNLPSRKMIRVNKKERDKFYNFLDMHLGT